MNAVQFIYRTGYAPVQDDLERVNCSEAGKIGHQQCGWCEKCDAPRFQCSHLAPPLSAPSTTKE